MRGGRGKDDDVLFIFMTRVGSVMMCLVQDGYTMCIIQFGLGGSADNK